MDLNEVKKTRTKYKKQFTLAANKLKNYLHIEESKENIKQAQRRAAAGRSRHKSLGVIQYLGSYFPHTMSKMDFHYYHRFS